MVMCTEQQFGIEITDEEAEKITTPGMLIDFVCTKVKMSDRKTCASQQAFYRLRRALVKRLDCSRNDLRPSTKLNQIFKVNDVKDFWLDLRKDTEAHDWPELTLPAGIKCLVVLIILSVFAAVFFLFHFSLRMPAISLYASAIAATLTASALYFIPQKYETAVPSGISTLSDLARYIAGYRLSYPRREWSRTDVAEKIKWIVIEALGIEESRYGESKSFTGDLGMS